MTDKRTILQQIKQSALSADPSAQIILFGSQARGDAHEESDWDVLVITDEEVTQEYKKRVRTNFYTLQLNLGISIGSLFVNKKKWRQPTAMPVYLEIKKDGVLL